MHPTIRVFTDRIEFQNPGGFIVPVSKVLQEAISLPRNPIIIKLFRFAKLSENAGYGIDKMKRWTTLTGKNVGFRSDVTHATVTYFKKFDIIDRVNEPINDGVNDHENDNVNDHKNDHENNSINKDVSINISIDNCIDSDPVSDHENDHGNNPVNDHEKISLTEETILRMMSKKDVIIYAEIQGKLSVSIPTIRRSIKKLRQKGFLVREGSDRAGRWIVTEVGKLFLQKKVR
jgi:predicted HTH transcriptional regulator